MSGEISFKLLDDLPAELANRALIVDITMPYLTLIEKDALL